MSIRVLLLALQDVALLTRKRVSDCGNVHSVTVAALAVTKKAIIQTPLSRCLNTVVLKKLRLVRQASTVFNASKCSPFSLVGCRNHFRWKNYQAMPPASSAQHMLPNAYWVSLSTILSPYTKHAPKGALSRRSSTKSSTLLRCLPSKACFSSVVFVPTCLPPLSPPPTLLLGLLCSPPPTPLCEGVSGIK